MKKLSRIVSALVLSAALSLGVGAAAFAADSSVTFKDHEEVFVFLDGSEYTETDLFDNFKNVMPGDNLCQTVEVSNDYSRKVNVYLRVLPHDEAANPPVHVGDVADTPAGDASAGDAAAGDAAAGESADAPAPAGDVAAMQDFLAQLTMTITWNGQVIYQASPDQAGALAQNVLLGEFAPGESRDLIVELNVPITMGDEYMNRSGEVDWVFVVEELDSKMSQTGDGIPVFALAGVVVVSALLVIVLAVMRRARK